MPLDSTEVRSFGSGRVWAAPLATAFPTAFDGAPGVGWVDLGYIDEAGPRFSFGRETNEVMVWQSYDPVRVINTRIPKEVTAKLMQTNPDVMELAMGGGAVDLPVALDTDNARFTLPAEEDVDERALIVDGYDGDIIHRWCFPRVQNLNGVEFAFVRSDATGYELKFKALAHTTRPYLLTNDPVFIAAA
jgi:hypothetical protein